MSKRRAVDNRRGDESDADEYEEWELDSETGEMAKVEEESL